MKTIENNIDKFLELRKNNIQNDINSLNKEVSSWEVSKYKNRNEVRKQTELMLDILIEKSFSFRKEIIEKTGFQMHFKFYHEHKILDPYNLCLFNKNDNKKIYKYSLQEENEYKIDKDKLINILNNSNHDILKLRGYISIKGCPDKSDYKTFLILEK